jgi:hypothetical protein
MHDTLHKLHCVNARNAQRLLTYCVYACFTQDDSVGASEQPGDSSSVKAHKRRHSSSSSSKHTSKSQPLQSNGESPSTVEAAQTGPKTEPDIPAVEVDSSSNVLNELHDAVPSLVSTHLTCYIAYLGTIVNENL